MKILYWLALLIIAGQKCDGFTFSNESLANLTINRAASVAPAGLYVQVSQRGLNYVAYLIKKVIPRLLLNYSIPAASGSGFEVKNAVIQKLHTPNISVQFMENIGVQAEVTFPLIEVTGQFSASMLWMTKQGGFRGVVHDLTIGLIMTMDRGSNGQPLMKIPVCEGETGEIVLIFYGEGSALFNTVRGFVESYLSNQLDEILCQVAMQATQYLENEVTGGSTAGSSNFDPTLLCKTNTRKKSSKPLPFDVNFRLTGEPYVMNHHCLLPIDGELLYKKKSVGASPEALPKITYGRKMISFAITERVPNTFFEHVYKNRLGMVDESLGVNDFPKLIQAPLRLLCWSCSIRLTAGLSEKMQAPRVQISDQGLTIFIEGEVRVQVNSPIRSFSMFKASLALEITAKPYIRQNAIYARDLKLSSYQTSVKDVGLGGALGKPINEVIKLLVPRKIWPRIKRQLRFVLWRKGYRLPVLCGVQLRRTELQYQQKAVLVDTDFAFNIDNFVEKFKKHVMSVNANRI